MNRFNASIVSAAVSGILLGTTGCGSTKDNKPADQSSTAQAAMEKHVCKTMNTCAGKGGCKTAANECAGKNSCKGKGGCATAAKHDCATKNECKAMGGCKTGDNGCAGKNSCKGKGGCAVPVTMK